MDVSSIETKSSRRRGWLLVHFSLVLLIAGWLSYIAITVEPASIQTPLRSIDLGWSPPGWAIGLWALAVLAMGVVPFYPLAGPLIFIAVVYGFPRYGAEWEFMLTIRLPECLVFLALTGWWTRQHFQGEPVKKNPSMLTLVLIGLIGWVGVTTAASLVGGTGWTAYVNRDPIRFVDSLVLFILAANTIKNKRDFCLLAGTLGLTLAVRSACSRPWHGDHDLAGLIAIALPLLISSVLIVRPWAWRLAFSTSAVFLLFVLMATVNRGAAVAVLVAILTAWLYSRHKWIWLMIGGPLLLGFALFFASTEYWQRFADIWEGGSGRSTAVSRLEIWQAALEISSEHPVLGIGTGNFYDLVQEYSDKVARRVPHNNFVTILVETGVPGLVLYVIFFGGAFVVLARVSRSDHDWRGLASVFLAAAIASYLAVGSFLTRQDLALAYLLVGAAVALHDQGSSAQSDDKAAI